MVLNDQRDRIAKLKFQNTRAAEGSKKAIPNNNHMRSKERLGELISGKQMHHEQSIRIPPSKVLYGQQADKLDLKNALMMMEGGEAVES